MRVSGQETLSSNGTSVNIITGTRKNDKRGMDISIVANDELDNAVNDPRFSIALAAGASDFYFYPAIPANIKRTFLSGVFTSSVNWKVELIVSGVSRYTIMGDPFKTEPIPFTTNIDLYEISGDMQVSFYIIGYEENN